jgi:hypothetical protein
VSAPWFSTPASESFDEPLGGYHYEWVDDEGSRVATPEEHAERKCRRTRCSGAPVMAFQRPRWVGGSVTRYWWLYCADHMYGRRIENGVVQHRRMVANESGNSHAGPSQ